MNAETLKTISLYAFFVFLFGAIGFIVAIILNALTLYNEASSSDMYETLVQTEIFSITNIPIYLLISALFAGIGLIIVYGWKHPNST